VAHKSVTDSNAEYVFQVLVLVAGLENVIEQLDKGTRKEVQVSRCSKKTGLGQNNHRSAHNSVVSVYVLLFSFFFVFCDFFSNIFLYAQKKKTHQVSDFFCAMTCPLEFLQVCPKIGINVWKMRSPISKTNLGILKTVNPAKRERIGCEI
jgi:hypothetical protein